MNSVDRISLGREFFGLSNNKHEKKYPESELVVTNDKRNSALTLGLNLPETVVSTVFSKYITPFELLQKQIYVSKAWHLYISKDILKVAVKILGFNLTPGITPGEFLSKNYIATKWIENPRKIDFSEDSLLADGLVELARTYPEGFKEKHVEMIILALSHAKISMIPQQCLTVLSVMVVALLLLPHNNNIRLFNICMKKISNIPILFSILPRDFSDPSNRVVLFYEILRLVPYLFKMIQKAFKGHHQHYDGLWTFIRNNQNITFNNPNVLFRYRQSEQYWSPRNAVEFHNQKWNATLNIIIKNQRERQYAADFQLIPPLLNA